MGTKRQKQAGPAKAAMAELDQPKPDHMLRVRNISHLALAIPSLDKMNDLFLGIQGEVVLTPDWAKSPNLRGVIERGQVEVEWVPPSYRPRVLPDLDNAPSDAQPETAFDRTYATQIMLTDPDEALRLIRVDVFQPGTEDPDIRFMKNRMWKILKAAEWGERQLQERRAVLEALDRRLQEIRAM